METFGDERGDIFSLAGICEALFLQCYENLQLPSSMTRTRAELQHERFHLWASYLGVFTSYNVSLDKRLEYGGEIRNLAVQLLKLVRMNLQFGKSQWIITTCKY